MLRIVMAMAQWAPWVSVFLGGCLSGAALLSLSADRAPESKVVTTPPRLATPAEPVDDHPAEASDEDAAEVPAPQDNVAETSDGEPEHPADEAGPSAADVLAELERAYQLQVAEAAAPPPAPEAALDGGAAEVENENVAPQVNPPALPDSEPEQVSAVAEAAPQDRRVALADDEEETHSRDRDPEQSRRPDDLDQGQVQQIAVVYQPVYVLPPMATPAQPTAQAPASRPIGLDPWTGVSWGMHNPWATTPPSGGAWATIGVSGGSWSAGFISRP